MWKELIETALLGTGKKIPDQTVLPEKIREIVNGHQHSDVESKFLETVALTYFYIESGKIAGKYKHDLDETPIDESFDIAPKQLIDLFDKIDILDGSLKETVCLPWLDLLIRKKYIVSPEYVVRLIQMGNSFSQKTKEKIIQVTGRKGEWILKYMTELKYRKPEITENIWLEGNTNSRKEYFKSLRDLNPADAIELLKSTWQEESVVIKKAFLDLILENPSQTDIPFLEDILKGEFAYNAKEKKTEKECRNIIASILLSLPGSEFHKVIMRQLSAFINRSKKKGLIGMVSGRETIEFIIPDNDNDVFWNSQNMEQTFGLETKNYDIAVFNSIKQFWFNCLLVYIPFDAWILATAALPGDMLSCFIKNPAFIYKSGGKEYPVFMSAIVENAKHFHDSELIQRLIPELAYDNFTALLKYLEMPFFEEFVQKNNFMTDYNILVNTPDDGTNKTWSKVFTENVINGAFELLGKNQMSLHYSLGKLIAEFGHAGALPVLFRLHQKAQVCNFYNNWNKIIFEPVNNALSIKSIIESFNN